jgi:hypothetical protein
MSILSDYLIPLDNFAETFEITLAGVDYTLTTRWNDAVDAGWILDIADSNQNPIAVGIPLITGADCLDGLTYLGIGGSLLVLTTGASPLDVPTFANLGIDSNLYFQTSNPNE